MSFYWNDKAAGPAQQYGFIAQQVRAVFPNLVTNTGMKTPTTPDGLLHLDYNGLFAPIVMSIKELDGQLEAEKSEVRKQSVEMEAEIAGLRAEVAELKAELRAMKVGR